MSFDGNVLYFYNKSKKTYDLFRNDWMQVSTYSATPLSRTEIQANRNSNNLLYRKTSPNHKTTISFSTNPLHLAEMKELREFINSHYTLKIQRKVRVKYWCDETMEYRVMDAYMPDVTYSYLDIDSKNKDILYASTEFELIEY